MRYKISFVPVFLFTVILITTLQADEPGSIVVWGLDDHGLHDVPTPNRDFIGISAGGWHCLGLKADGSVTAWGNNMYGQCDVPTPNTDFVAISAGIGHNLGLKADSSVTAWGTNGTRQCDVPLPNTGFVEVSACSYSLGVKTEGSIVSWGDIFFLGRSLESNTGFVSAATATFYDLGLKTDGSVVVWGAFYNNEDNVPAPNAGFVAISTSSSHCLGLKADGSVVAWGLNSSGQCDVPALNTDFVAIAAGDHHSLGLKADGSIVAWGSNDRGQCDVPTPNIGFTAIAASYRISMGLKSGTFEIGSLQVMIEPPEVIDAGAKWRRVGTTNWHYSGYIETGIPSGQCTIEFKDISELVKPANLNVNILTGQTERIIVEYNPEFPKIHGRVTYEEGNQEGPVVGIPVYVYQEGVAQPVWDDTSDTDGYYETDTFNDNYNPDGSQRFYVEAKWEDEVVRIEDNVFREQYWPISWINWEDLINVIKPDDPQHLSQLPPSLDLIFNDSDAVQDYNDASALFHHVHDANRCMNNKFHYIPSRVTALIHAELFRLDGIRLRQRIADYLVKKKKIRFRLGVPVQNIEQVWHEYAHAVHHQNVDYFKDISEGFAEGWAIFFANLRDPVTAFSMETNWRFENTGRSEDKAHRWGYVYRGIFYDIYDGDHPEIILPPNPPLADDDEIDGTLKNGAAMVWNVIMEDEATDIFDFYNKFSKRYPGLQQDLFEIYDAHGIWDIKTATTTGKIPPASTLSMAAPTDSTVKRSRFQLSWTGSDLDLTLTNPSGRVINPVYAANDPNITFIEEQTQEQYTVEKPEPGEWQMNVTAVDVPPEGEDYSTTAYVTTALMLMLSSDKETYNINEPIMLTAELLYDAKSYSDANVTVKIQTPEGIENVMLFDDGLHNDANSGDGIYANTYMKTSVEGQYNVIATASGTNPFSEPFTRETSKMIEVRNLPDLIPLELTIDYELSLDQVTLAALVGNDGSKDANDILIRFYDVNDANAVQIGNDITIGRLESNETIDVKIICDFTEVIHNFIVTVDPLDTVLENDETNNYLSDKFCVGWESQGDLNNDCIVNLLDLAELAGRWLESCSGPDWCSGADINKDGRVDFSDILIMVDHWLSDI